MGNDVSTVEFEGPPEKLKGRDIASLAEYIKSDECKNVFLMLGAGVSTSAGIPDFRSPETGLYANLQRLNLPYPEAVFEINFFRENPAPFYTLAKELFPGRYRPTPTHSFAKVMHNRQLLQMCYTQNIDTLERLAGVPDEAIVEAHGSFADQHCIECGSRYDGHKLKDQILSGEIAYCYECGGLVKPDIVFFGEALPPRFHKTVGLLQSADLLLVIGTSLTVHPFASLTQLVPDDCPRVLINMDRAGDIGTRADDVLLLGKSDDVVRDLCQALGDDWVEELDAMWKETEKYSMDSESRETPKAHAKDEVDKLAKEIERSLQIGKVPTDEAKDEAKEDAKKEEKEDAAPVEDAPVDPAAEESKETAPAAIQESEKDGAADADGAEKVQVPDAPAEEKSTEVKL